MYRILVRSHDKKNITLFLDENNLSYKVIEDLKAVSMVGMSAMEKTSINPKLLECISNHDIKIYMSFSNRISATVVVENSKFEKSMLAIHKEFSS